MLIILLVVLSAARPLLRSDRLKPSRKHPPTAIAILLDTSYSMDYLIDSKSWMDRAKQALREINQKSNPEDRIILITSDEAWNSLHAQIYAGTIPEDLIENIGISYQALSLEIMMELASAKLKDSQLQNREVYLLSDFSEQEPGKNPAYKIHVIPLSSETSFANISCSAAEPIPQLVERSRLQSIKYDLANHGETERRDVLVKAVVNNVKVAEKFINVPPNQTVSDIISFDIRTDGWQQGYIEVLDDRLIHDNRSYFAFTYYLNPKVAVVSQKSTIPLALSSMLSVYTGERGKVDVIAPETVTLESLRSYNLVVLYEAGALNDRLVEVLKGLQQRQSGVLYTMGSELDAPWKAHLKNTFALNPTRLQKDPASISYHNRHHYVTSLLNEEQLRRVEVRNYWSAEGMSRGNTLLAANNSPLAVVGKSAVLWLWDMNSRDNRLFSEPAYAVFAYRCFQYLGNSVQGSQSRTVGESIVTDTLTFPDGRKLELSKRNYILPQPGIYQIGGAEIEPGFIAVNVDYSESDYIKADYSTDKRFKLLSQNWQKELFQSRMGHDLWKLFLILALLLMFVEIIIVKLAEAKPKSPQNQ